MKVTQLVCIFSFLCCSIMNAQTQFPQDKINAIGKNFSVQHALSAASAKPENKTSAYRAISKMEEVKKMNLEHYTHGGSGESRSLDTIYVGEVPHDTMVITGTFDHEGPIFVFNDGVLIFNSATVTNYGDVYVFQHGKIRGVSSDLTFPQTYFYQRSLIVVQNGTADFTGCNFNYSGMQHNLVIGDSGKVTMENVHQSDWTTAGLFGNGSILVHGMNLGGEYILTDFTTSDFSNVDTLLLWHKMPTTAVINYAFPNGDTVMNYEFNNSVTGVAGINYNVTVDSCYTVWWGMMPVNGSDITISDSHIRAIGTWFEHGDSTTVDGIFNNTLYADSVLPFNDRNIHLINSFVQTWSLYVFDSSQLSITNSTVGEVGTQQKSHIESQQFLLDGSGGYFWSTDTSAIIASNVTVYSTARSEKNGIFILAYSYLPFAAPASIHTSLFVSVQNNLPADPVPYDGSAMWMEKIESPVVAHADSLISITGSEWIDQGPLGNPVDYGSYSLYYRLQGTITWIPIVIDSVMEIRHNTLGIWNTNALTEGTYILRLVVKNNHADSVEDFVPVTMLPSVTTTIHLNENNLLVAVFPNPATDYLTVYFSENNPKADITIYNLLGQTKITSKTNGLKSTVNIEQLSQGVYLIEIKSEDGKKYRQRFVKN